MENTSRTNEQVCNAVITKDNWESFRNAWKASKLTQPEFCKQQGIDYAKFQYYLYGGKKNKHAKSLPKQKLIPIAINREGSLAIMTDSHVNIKFPNGIILTVSEKVNEVALKKICFVVSHYNDKS